MTTNLSGKETPPKEAALPKKIGTYKIESLLDKGGMSLLYLGIHPDTHEPIAIKVLLPKYVSNSSMVEQFLREASIIELTCHPNIVKLFGHGKWAGGVYIAMEFIQGISLRQMILQEAMSLKRSLEVVLQIAYALTHLHAHGIIHRDLKPENILLTAQGGVKVIDFGISQMHTEPSLLGKHMSGTPIYMSPEQRIDPTHVSFSTDLYALAIIAYELVTGRLSYGTIHISMVPRGLQKILAKALQPKPEDRYEDIVDFTKAISTYLASSELKKDMRGTDYAGEISENLKVAQRLLIPGEIPKWPRLEIAVASNYNAAVSSLYYDFFQSKEGVYNIVLAESLITGVEGMLHIAILKGMVRALSPTMDLPTEFVKMLNTRIVEAGISEVFLFSLLTLYPVRERFSYISCGYPPLWAVSAGAESPRRIMTENALLGKPPVTDVIEIDANFSMADTLVLHTFQARLARNKSDVEIDEAQFLEALMENIFLSPQKQVDAIFRKISQKEGRAFFEKPVVVIGIDRSGM
jgi:eukaryotic-like serine/threonine-protein kinase